MACLESAIFSIDLDDDHIDDIIYQEGGSGSQKKKSNKKKKRDPTLYQVYDDLFFQPLQDVQGAPQAHP